MGKVCACGVLKTQTAFRVLCQVETTVETEKNITDESIAPFRDCTNLVLQIAKHTCGEGFCGLCERYQSPTMSSILSCR